MKKIIITISLAIFAASASGQDTDKLIDHRPVQGDQAVSPDSFPAKIFTAIDEMPEFPGGQAGLMQYLAANIKYPSKARAKDVQGRVIVKFVVCQDGTLCNEEVVRPIGGGCDEEVIRVVKAMPRWKPGKQNGQAVKVYYTLPVSFKLSDDKAGKERK